MRFRLQADRPRASRLHEHDDRELLTHAVAKPCQPRQAAVSARDSRTWKAATFSRRIPWGRPYRASTTRRPMSQQFVPILYPPGTPQPTAAEVARESFIAKGYGTYTVGPGRFDTQSLVIHGYGKPMTSNLSRRFHFQYEVTEPVNKAQAVTGVMSLVGGNFLQNSALQILDLIGPTGTGDQRPAD